MAWSDAARAAAAEARRNKAATKGALANVQHGRAPVAARKNSAKNLSHMMSVYRRMTYGR